MYLWMAEIFGSLTGLFAALTLVLIPNLFGFAHFAVTDMPLAVMWFLTVYCFWRGLKDWRWSAVLGLVWGLALSTKFPAIVIPIPLFLWAHLFRRQAYGNNVFSMFFLGPIIMIVVQPYLWHDTFLRILEFLFEGVSRTHRPDTNYPVFFDNQPLFSKQLPWYYSFFITGVTTPEIFLALAFVGVSSAVWLKPQRDFIILFVFNALFVPTLGLLPGAVLHDGVRQLMSALPFLGGLAGGGFFALAKYVGGQSQKFLALQRIRNLQPKLAGILFILFLFPPALDLFVYHPYELSYYNRLVGGIRGAFQRGLEVTYFMEAFTPEFLGRLNKELPPNAVINAAISNFMFEYYQQRGRLRPDIRISDENFEYVVLLNRRSVLGEGAKSLIENVQPHEALRLDGVPLILIYKVRK
jgi:4-amino-4-deoxy-L-arabinose transferase-like glycosyltransferase